MSKRLVLVRHAHRDLSKGRELDNGLSRKGWQQEARLRKHWKKKLSGHSVTFVSSPKLRCVETVAPLAAALDRDVDVLELLDERDEAKETAAQFRARIKRFLTWCEGQESDYVVAASHGDWIPECLELARGEAEDVAKGDWRKIKFES